MDAAAITDSENSGSVTGTSFVGGIAGFCAGTSTADIAYCYNTATISGSNYVGGLAGTAGRNGTVTNSYNVGTVDCSGTCGGVAGTLTAGSEANISNTYYKSSCAAGGVAGEDIDGTVSVKSMQTAGGELAYLLNTNDTAGDYRWVQDEDSLIPVLSDEGVDQLPYQVAMYYQQSGSDPVFYGNVYTQSDGTILLPGPNIDYFAVEGYYVMKNGTVTGTAFSANTAVTADMAVCAVLTYSEGTVYEDEDSYQGQSSDTDTDRSYDDYETDVTDFEAWTDHYGEWVTQSDGSAIDTMVIYANLYFDEPVRLADNMSVDDLKEELSVQVGSWSVESSKDFDVEISADGCELSFTIYIGYALYGGHLVIWPENEDAGLSSLVFEDGGQAVDVKADLVVPNGLYTEITSVTVGTADTPASTTVKLIARNEDNDHTTRGMIHMAMLSNGESALGTINVYGGNLTGHWHDYQNLTAEEYWTLGYIDEDKLAEYGYTASFDGDEMTITANEAKEGEVLEFHIVSYLNNGTVETDRTALNRIISAAEKVTDGGSADDDAWETFVTKLALAEAAQESSYYSQDDIDTKTEELILAYKALGYEYSDTEGDTLAFRRGNVYYFQDTLGDETATSSVVYGKDTDDALVGDWDGDGYDTICLRRGNTYYFSNTLGGNTEYSFSFGKSTDEVLVGDWDGDGIDTLCLRRGSTFYICNSADSGMVESTFTLGESTDEILVGDWDGDGIDTLSIRSGNVFYIYNTLGGEAEYSFSFGKSTDSVIVGDWDGDGTDGLCLRRGTACYISNDPQSGTIDASFSCGQDSDEVYAGTWGEVQDIIPDTLGLRRGNTFYISYSLEGSTDLTFTCGKDTDEILVGDWDGDGLDTICLRRGNRYYFSNTLGGEIEFYIDFGKSTDEVFAGDWDGDGVDTLCIQRDNHYYINNTLEGGNAETDFSFGKTTDEVLAGDWDGDGCDTLCIRRGNAYYMNNTLEGGYAEVEFSFGKSTDSVIVGDWDADGCDTLCIRRGSTYFIDNSLTGGNAETSFVFGKETDEVFAGKWK
ncbi:MAG: hypothetical protein LUF32_09285 [Clostridiales bacterium]|nr:hypothetical protein [Clostridiales bacterium]